MVYAIVTATNTKKPIISNKICAAHKRYLCKGIQSFKCPKGYYAVCANSPGKGYFETYTKSVTECSDRCKKEQCTGLEWDYSSGPKGTRLGLCTILLPYSTVPCWKGLKACYRYGAECPIPRLEDSLAEQNDD